MIKSPKKIVFVLPNFYSGGAERALITLMNNVDKALYEVEMIVLDNCGALSTLVASGIKVHSLGGAKIPYGYFKVIRKLRDIQPDIVITTMVHSNILLMLMKPFFPKTKFIIREAVVPSSILQKHSKKAPLIKLMYKCLYPIAHCVISPSQDIVDEFKKLIGLNTANHRVLYNQVNLEHIEQSIAANEPVDPKDDILKFICVGRLHYQKGYDRLIRALAKSFCCSKEWRLDILGDGEELGRLKDLVSSCGLEEHIFFHGIVRDPWSMMADADCLLLPSRWEGMPNVVLESLACGTPTIASSEANGVSEIQRYAVSESIKVAEDMDNFVELMKNTEKRQDIGICLPDRFKTESIMREFESILVS